VPSLVEGTAVWRVKKMGPDAALSASAPDAASISMLVFILAIAVLNTTEILKILYHAFVRPIPPQDVPDPWWHTLTWRVVPLVLGVLYGWLSEFSSYFDFPWGAGAGLIAATFMTAIYSKGKRVIEGLRIRGIDSSENDS